VLQVLVSTQAGGGPQHVLTVALGLRARGWRSIVAGPPGGVLFARFRECGVETVALRTDRVSALTVLRLVRAIRRHGVRLVHSHGKGAGLHARLAARLAGVPAVHTLHGIHYERYPAPARALYLALERRLSACTRVVINVSRAQEAEGLALHLFSASQSRVILNGVDVARLTARALDRWDARAELGLDPGVRVVGTAARFDAVKRLDLLLRALAAMPPPGAMLVLIGAGGEEQRLRALSDELGLAGCVRFAGEMAEAARVFRAFDVFAAPSRKEGLPLAVVEAMALGLPVVATDIPAHRETLGLSAGLVDGTVEAFAKGLVEVLDDADLQLRLGGENRTRARSEFDARAMLTELESVYGDVLAV
jgi:glycosyltransferase involved in cell wall biosynthesis